MIFLFLFSVLLPSRGVKWIESSVAIVGGGMKNVKTMQMIPDPSQCLKMEVEIEWES